MLKKNGVLINDIFRKHHRDYCKKYRGHISPRQYKVINAVTTCRTINLGGHLYKCESCNKYHIVYNSCKNRHCPTCQSLKAAGWLLKRKTELLPIQYFHIVFTVPDALNPLFLQNKQIMYNLLFMSVSQTLMQLSREKKIWMPGRLVLSVYYTHGVRHCLIIRISTRLLPAADCQKIKQSGYPARKIILSMSLYCLCGSEVFSLKD